MRCDIIVRFVGVCVLLKVGIGFVFVILFGVVLDHIHCVQVRYDISRGEGGGRSRGLTLLQLNMIFTL